MGNEDGGGRTQRFATYLAELASVLGDARRSAAMISYCTGLLLPSERKSVEPMAALTAPTRTAAQHQSLLHFVGQGEWSDDVVMERIRAYTIARIERHGAISAWIIDDTGFPKKGRHSVGVARQYCGQLGKQDNCQVAVSLSLANDDASLPVAYRLYLPQSWVNDAERRAKVGVPKDVDFRTKPQIALEQIKWACEADLPRGVVVMDAGYGVEAKFRSGISALNLKYVAGVKTTTTVWAPDTLATSRSANSGRGRHPACARGPADNYCRPCCPRLIPDTVAIVIKPMSTNLTMERPHRKNGCTDGLPLFLGERPIKRFALGQSDADLVRCRPTW